MTRLPLSDQHHFCAGPRNSVTPSTSYRIAKRPLTLQGLEEARDSFEARLADVRSLHGSARALSDTGRSVDLPDGRPTARSLRALAERVDADPNAVRNRRRQLDAVSTYVESGRQAVEPALKRIVDEARAGIEVGTVSALRKIGSKKQPMR